MIINHSVNYFIIFILYLYYVDDISFLVLHCDHSTNKKQKDIDGNGKFRIVLESYECIRLDDG